ncbi:MAG: Hint domain-containing protein [Acidocella sp.]|nr:Hint domain-containing protein [Acidocella sp.]
MSLTLNPGSTSVYTLTDEHSGGGSTVVSSNVTLAPGTAPSNFISSGGTLLYNGAPPCFYAGTRLATADGDIAVEDITAATLLMTAAGESKPVRWLGRSQVSTRFADPLRVLPVRIKAGALGESLPLRDLLVSPDHAMFIGGVLVQAGALVNGSSIIREADVPECFTYYHVELATHELLLAEGAATESFVDNVDRMGFANWAEHEALGETAPIEEMDIPRAKSQRQVPVAVRALLAARALAFQEAAAA